MSIVQAEESWLSDLQNILIEDTGLSRQSGSCVSGKIIAILITPARFFHKHPVCRRIHSFFMIEFL